MQRITTIVFAIATALAAGAIPAAAQSAPKVGVGFVTAADYRPVVGKFGGRLVRDTLGEPKSFNPITAGETSTTEYTDRIFQGLTTSDPFTGEMIPLLAEKWQTSDDGLSWTFQLRRDVTFNDGTPLTAADVVFTWNDLIYDLSRPDMNQPARWPCSTRDATTFEGKIIKVEQVDDHTVRFTTPVKIAIVDELVATPILPRHKYAEFVKAGTFGGAMGADSRPEDIVGTGPFVLGEYARGAKVVLKRNPRFWKKDAAGNSLPYLDEMVFLVTRDANIMLLNFQQGITDVFGLRSGKDVAALRPRQQADNFTLYQLGPDYGTFFVTFNMNKDAAKAGKIPQYKVDWFGDTRFRKAVSYAIDRPALIRNVLRNLGYSLPAPFTLAAGPYRQDGFAPHPHDPAKARALLAEMGLKDRDGDGIIEDEQGHKVSFTINTNAGNNIREDMADFIRKDLSEIGMEVNTLFLEFNLLVDKMDVNFDWECILMGLTGGTEPHWGANVWKSSGRLHMWWPNQLTPATAWEKRIDEAFAQGIQELDKAKRKALYREWVQIVYDQQPFIYLTTTERVAALRNKFGNIFPSATPSGLLHNEEEIFVK